MSSQPSLSRKGPSAREAVRCAKLSNSAIDTCVRRAHSGAGTPRLVILMHNVLTTSLRTQSSPSMCHSNASLLLLEANASSSKCHSVTSTPKYLRTKTKTSSKINFCLNKGGTCTTHQLFRRQFSCALSQLFPSLPPVPTLRTVVSPQRLLHPLPRPSVD